MTNETQDHKYNIAPGIQAHLDKQGLTVEEVAAKAGLPVEQVALMLRPDNEELLAFKAEADSRGMSLEELYAEMEAEHGLTAEDSGDATLTPLDWDIILECLQDREVLHVARVIDVRTSSSARTRNAAVVEETRGLIAKVERLREQATE